MRQLTGPRSGSIISGILSLLLITACAGSTGSHTNQASLQTCTELHTSVDALWNSGQSYSTDVYSCPIASKMCIMYYEAGNYSHLEPHCELTDYTPAPTTPANSAPACGGPWEPACTVTPPSCGPMMGQQPC